MSGKATAEEQKKQATEGKAASCGDAMTAEMTGCCGGKMREMMSRFAAPCGTEKQMPPQCGEGEGDSHEDK